MAVVDCTRTRKTVTRALIDNGDGSHSVPLSQGKFALIDSEMTGAVGRFNWYDDGQGYAVTTLCKPTQANVYLHHLVVGKPLGKLQIDHINHDRLDNRRCNLRIVTVRGNQGNRTNRSKTGFVGVQPHRNKFQARICLNSKNVRLGSRDTPEEAARLYDACLRVLHENVALGNGSTVVTLRDLASIQIAFDRAARRG